MQCMPDFVVMFVSYSETSMVCEICCSIWNFDLFIVLTIHTCFWKTVVLVELKSRVQPFKQVVWKLLRSQGPLYNCNLSHIMISVMLGQLLVLCSSEKQRLKENALFGLQDEAIPILLSTWKSLVKRTESFCKNLGTVASLTYKQWKRIFRMFILKYFSLRDWYLCNHSGVWKT